MYIMNFQKKQSMQKFKKLPKNEKKYIIFIENKYCHQIKTFR